MLMSVASYHLWLPWRESGLHLARLFVDCEPGIHWRPCTSIVKPDGAAREARARIWARPQELGFAELANAIQAMLISRSADPVAARSGSGLISVAMPTAWSRPALP